MMEKRLESFRVNQAVAVGMTVKIENFFLRTNHLLGAAKMIKKTIQRSEECFVQFTKEELEQLNIKEGDKFTWEVQGDDSIALKKFGTIDIDFAEFDREILEFLIAESCEKDVSVNEIISDILEQIVKQHKRND